MKNLSRLFQSDGKFYSVLGIKWPRGINKRIPLYFIGSQLAMGVLEQIPISPFKWIISADPILGIAINHIVICGLVTYFMASSNGNRGRSHEAQLRSLYHHHRSVNHFALYRATPRPTTYRFDSEVTCREVPRRPAD